MSWRAYSVFIGVMMFMLGAVMPAALIDGGPPFVHEMIAYALAALGALCVLMGMLQLGLAMATSNHVACPHCQHESDVHIGFWNGKPSLVKKA
jgi:fumarate reductase subunit D